MIEGLLKEILQSGAEEFGLNLPDSAITPFYTFYKFLESHGKKFNLTAISGIEDVARLHFLDSIALMQYIDFTNLITIDVGTGAGFPGLPITIANPTVQMTLLDATGKRVEFLSQLCKTLELECICVHDRAETASHDDKMRCVYDVALSRAVASLRVLCELCLPFLRIGGKFLAMKGPSTDRETLEALTTITALGGEVENCFEYRIPNTEIFHKVIIISKCSATPDEYPRRFKKILNYPI